MAPTGSKDPFALRRAANAIVKILAESDLPLTIRAMLSMPATAPKTPTAESKSAAFFRERLHFYLKDVRGFAYDVVNAVLAAGADDVRDAIARAEALTAVRGSEDFAAVSAAFKRIKNILRQAEEKDFEIGSPSSIKLASEAHQLADAAADASRPRWPDCARSAPTPSAGPHRHPAPGSRHLLRQGDGARPRPGRFAAHNLALIDGVLRSFSTIADFSEIVTG